MYGALDGESGQRVGNSIKSSLLGKWAGLPSIERKCAADREYLRDLDRRKALAGRIRRIVAECAHRGDTSQPEIERRLSEAGISAVFRHNDDGRLTGATFIDHRGKTVYNGSNLSKDLSANGWWALFNAARSPEPSPQQTPEQTPEHPSPERPTPEHSAPETAPLLPTEPERPVSTPEPAPEYTEDYEEDIDLASNYGLPTATERAATHHVDHGTFHGLTSKTTPYEPIDPEFRSLYKRRKKRQRKL